MNPWVDTYLNKAVKWRQKLEKLRQAVLDCGQSKELKWGKFKYTGFLLLLLLAADLTWSFNQYYHTILDGDMAGGIVTNEHVSKVLNDPFGTKAVYSGEPHVNPNRFFPHLIFKYYFRTAPHVFQVFTTPVNSIYLACAFMKLMVHMMILFFLASVITGYKTVHSTDFLGVSVLLTSLFQTYGFHDIMGIIQISISYLFFYALPVSFLLLFIYLAIKLASNKIPGKWTRKLSLATLAVLSLVLPFSGPLVPPIIVILSGLLLIHHSFRFMQSGKVNVRNASDYLKKIPGSLIFIYIAITLFSIYSVYLGTYDDQYSALQVPMEEKYSKLLSGVEATFIRRFGFRYLLIFIPVNIVIIRLFYYDKRGRTIIRLMMWILAFSIIYISLLPFGGYRPYRELIIRSDTLIPVTLALFYIFGLSAYHLVNHINIRVIWISYLILLGLILYSYTWKDRTIQFDNSCEKEALITISESKDDIVVLKSGCQVLSWDVITDYRRTEMNGQLLMILGVTDTKKMYYTPLPKE